MNYTNKYYKKAHISKNHQYGIFFWSNVNGII